MPQAYGVHQLCMWVAGPKVLDSCRSPAHAACKQTPAACCSTLLQVTHNVPTVQCILCTAPFGVHSMRCRVMQPAQHNATHRSMLQVRCSALTAPWVSRPNVALLDDLWMQQSPLISVATSMRMNLSCVSSVTAANPDYSASPATPFLG
jgi:hypothetical protein